MIKQTDGTSYVWRNYGGFPSNAVNWTIFFRFKYSVLPVGITDILALFSGAPDFTGSYVSFRSSLNTSDFNCKIFNGVSTVTTATAAITNNAQNWGALTYDAGTHTATLILNGVVVGAVVIDLSGIVWSSLALLGSTVASSGNVEVAYFRMWSSILTITQLTAEAASITAVVIIGLINDNLLQSSTDLTSHNNTLTHLKAIGTVTTDFVDPLISTVVGPPTNIDPNTATLVTYNSTVFQNTLTAGVATTVWHKAVVVTGDKVWGASAFGDLVTYTPAIFVYASLADALANNVLVTANPNLPVQFPVTFGQTIYFKSNRNGAVTPATLQLSILRGLTIKVPVGSIGIPDDSPPFSLALLDVGTGYPINWVNNFANGEQGSIFPTGEVVAGDTSADTNFYDSKLNLVSIPTFPVGSYNRIGVSQNFAYVAKQIGGIFVKVTKLGVIGATQYNTTNDIRGLTASPGDDIAYYINQTTGAVSRWDIINNIAMTDLAAAVASYAYAQAPICLLDGKIVVGYSRSGVNNFCRVYNPNGTTFIDTALFSPSKSIDYIFTDKDDPTFFWIWSQSNTVSEFRKIRVSDAAVVADIDNVRLYESGQYQLSPINTPDRFGNSNSCPGWITRIELFSSVVVGSGLYFLTGTNLQNPKLTHDVRWIDASVGTKENVAIPTPFFELFADGDKDADA